ncbi:hypothetical protein EXN66_Car015528 [Channa argus]|uniref:Uncharacterized protein n=1 Tax=Channa argus TaxID=215402 RepID=A0A6G1QB27_CHAAH|nr:hypothetical protein EXN66_Car015528 [Channa argus]
MSPTLQTATIFLHMSSLKLVHIPDPTDRHTNHLKSDKWLWERGKTSHIAASANVCNAIYALYTYICVETLPWDGRV